MRSVGELPSVPVWLMKSLAAMSALCARAAARSLPSTRKAGQCPRRRSLLMRATTCCSNRVLPTTAGTVVAVALGGTAALGIGAAALGPSGDAAAVTPEGPAALGTGNVGLDVVP